MSTRLTTEQTQKLEPYIGYMTDERQAQVTRAMQGIEDVIDLCGDDKEREGLEETPFRVLKAFLEYTCGYREDPKQHLYKTFDVAHDELILVKDIDFYSLCEHHFALFQGVAHVAYIPKNKVTGLSKIARLVDGYAKRFQVQERLTSQIASAMTDVLEPTGVMVIVEAKHTCMCSRGVQKQNAWTTTSAVRGAFKEDSQARNECLQLIHRS